MNIEIYIPNYRVLVQNGILFINDKSCYITDEILSKIVSFTINWEDKYSNDSMLVGEPYYVSIGTKKYIFNNKYPSNINELKDYLGELYDRISI